MMLLSQSLLQKVSTNLIYRAFEKCGLYTILSREAIITCTTSMMNILILFSSFQRKAIMASFTQTPKQRISIQQSGKLRKNLQSDSSLDPGTNQEETR
jgi:hypothetical protein